MYKSVNYFGFWSYQCYAGALSLHVAQVTAEGVYSLPIDQLLFTVSDIRIS